jgi:DNA adenine methylase
MKRQMKTPISYYGGKQRMLQHILPLIPEHTLYAEPFCGAATVLFGKQLSEVEVINDTNRELINFYRVAQNNFLELQSMIRVTLHSRRLHRDAQVVYQNPHLFSEIKRAWSIWVLASESFAGQLNGAFGYDITKNTMSKKIANSREAFNENVAIRLQQVQLECADALYIIQSRDSLNSFFYCDPPYYNAHCDPYKGYTIDDFEKLLQTLANIKGKFLLSSYPSDILTKYTKANNWHYKVYEQGVAVNGKRRYQKRKWEVLTANYTI